MNKLTNYFYCFLVGIGFMLLSVFRTITHNTIFLSEFIERELMEHLEYFLYNVGYLIIIITGIIILIKACRINR